MTWNAQTAQAFDDLRMAMTQAPCLALPGETRPFLVEIDASEWAIGGVLYQLGESDLYRPVAFDGRKFQAAEYNYPVHKKKLLVIKEALRKWRNYIDNGHMTTVLTDHQSLTLPLKMYWRYPIRGTTRASCQIETDSDLAPITPTREFQATASSSLRAPCATSAALRGRSPPSAAPRPPLRFREMETPPLERVRLWWRKRKTPERLDVCDTQQRLSRGPQGARG